MNIFGRILLILGALCFLAISIYLIVKTIALSNASTPPDIILTIISWISIAVLLFGGVGGVFYGFGGGFFGFLIRPLLTLVSLAWVGTLIYASIAFSHNPAPENFWEYYNTAVLIAPAEIFFGIGYSFVRRS
jgi:uncharacterized membrane protein